LKKKQKKVLPPEEIDDEPSIWDDGEGDERSDYDKLHGPVSRRRDINSYPLKGFCSLCQTDIGARAAKKHLIKEITTQSDLNKPDSTFLLVAKSDPFWMYIQISENATVQKLDDLLRTEWVDCCGHMSYLEFYPEGKKRGKKRCFWYSEQNFVCLSHNHFDDMEAHEHSMDSVKAKDVMRVNGDINYAYDFGTPTHVFLTVLEKIPNTADKNEATCEMIAKNKPPVWICSEKRRTCNNASKYICSQCGIAICKECKHRHIHDERLLPVVNSPRMGACGYCG